MRTWLRNLFYSFPVQLLLLNLRSNLALLSLWVVILLFSLGLLGQKLGFQYLFLDPEYLGKVNFWSFFFIGVAYGGLFMTWNLTTYLLNAHKFPFLASLARPFTKFTINNLLMPLFFFGVYIWWVIWFQGEFSQLTGWGVAKHLAGLICGGFALVVSYALYFRFTNRDISYYHTDDGEPPPHLTKTLSPGRRGMDLDLETLDAQRLPVRTYLTEQLRTRLVRSVAHYDSSLLLGIFRQNHLNALVIQLLSLIMLMFLGWMIDYSWFQIPAGASILIFCSVATALLGAITYWFDEWRATILILILVGLNYLTSFRTFSHVNKAYGLDYKVQPAEYSHENLRSVCFSDRVEQDREATERILDNWLARQARRSGRKPKMVLMALSGGGFRSVTWTLHLAQTLDSLMEGRLLDRTALITGASGGILGMAYYRELYLREKLGEELSRLDRQHINWLTRDLLNPVAFALTTNDLFLPWGQFKVGEQVYRKDRGYVFEQKLNENSGGLMDKAISDYREPERSGLIPMMFITPSVVNDARRLILSPQGVTYMMSTPLGTRYRDDVEIDAVDFGWLFAQQDADSLRFLSALRMNATYPYVLPTVHLPSKPELEVIDAGFRDNFGLLSATRFAQVFKDWILEHTSGLVIIQVNSSQKLDKIDGAERKGVIESLVNPIGIATQVLNLQEYEQDNNLGLLMDVLGEDMLHISRFTYMPPANSKLNASISFHITERERELVYQALESPENQEELRELLEVLGR